MNTLSPQFSLQIHLGIAGSNRRPCARIVDPRPHFSRPLYVLDDPFHDEIPDGYLAGIHNPPPHDGLYELGWSSDKFPSLDRGNNRCGNGYTSHLTSPRGVNRRTLHSSAPRRSCVDTPYFCTEEHSRTRVISRVCHVLIHSN